MEKIHFSLELHDTNRFTRVLYFVFGLICIAIAIYWLIYNINQSTTDWKLVITVIFLTLFGFYQLASGAGRVRRYFEIDGDLLKLKRSSILPSVIISASDLKSIEIFPLKIHFNTGKRRILFRLGVTELEKAELIKESVSAFAIKYGISCNENPDY